MSEIIKHIFDTSYNDINQYILKINLKDKFLNSPNQFTKQYISPCFDDSLCENIVKEYDHLHEITKKKNIDIIHFSNFLQILNILNNKLTEITGFYNIHETINCNVNDIEIAKFQKDENIKTYNNSSNHLTFIIVLNPCTFNMPLLGGVKNEEGVSDFASSIRKDVETEIEICKHIKEQHEPVINTIDTVLPFGGIRINELLFKERVNNIGQGMILVYSKFCFTPFRVEDEQSSILSSLITADEACILNENMYKPLKMYNYIKTQNIDRTIYLLIGKIEFMI